MRKMLLLCGFVGLLCLFPASLLAAGNGNPVGCEITSGPVNLTGGFWHYIPVTVASYKSVGGLELSTICNVDIGAAYFVFS